MQDEIDRLTAENELYRKAWCAASKCISRIYQELHTAVYWDDVEVGCNKIIEEWREARKNKYANYNISIIDE
jgi:hypothetical protein